jgi:DNA-binding CsgD family transcriptional regulator
MGLGTVERWGLVLLTMVCLLGGGAEEARDHLHRAKAIRADAPPSAFSYDTDRAEAWMTAAVGALPEARDRLVAAAGRARRHGVAAQEAALLHDVVRFGGGPGVAERLAALAATTQGELIGVRAAHARAVADRDAAALTGVSQAFERLGSALWAAEAAAQLAELYRQRGDEDAAREPAVRAEELGAADGLRTPALRAGPPAAVLSAREREVAQLAAGGLPSREIAERLYLSVRTVENHLQRTYAKLGLSGREQLSDALAAQAPPVPPGPGPLRPGSAGA